MNAGKWIVKVSAGFWMAGLHRFQTKRAATEFFHKWIDGAYYVKDLPAAITEPRREVP